MKSRGTVIGAVLVGAICGSLPFLLRAASGHDDLSVMVPAAFQIRDNPGAPVATLATTMSSTTEHLLPSNQPGLDLIMARKVYGGAYQREVTWPSLVGPFHAEGDYVCGYNLYLGAGLFDTSGAGSGLQKLIREKIAPQFPYHALVQGIDVSLPAVASTDLALRLGDGFIQMGVTVVLVDSTVLAIEFPVRLVMKDQAPYIERLRDTQPTVRFDGPSKERIVQQARDQGTDLGALGGCGAGLSLGPIGCLGGMIFGGLFGESVGESKAKAEIPKTAEDLATKKIDEALADLALGMEHFRDPLRPLASRPRDEIRLRLDAEPIVTASGIELPLCLRVVAGSPTVDSTIPGPVSFGSARLAHREVGVSTATLGLAMNADAVNQIVYYLWQAGLLRDAGESTLVLDGLAKEVRMAAFEFTGLDPRLPPTLMPSSASVGNALPFTLGNVKLGTAGTRNVVGHGQASLGAIQEGDSILLQGLVSDVRVNCSEPNGAGIKLTPCLGDLLPVVREIARSKSEPKDRPSFQFSGADVLGKLPQVGFQGVAIALSDLQVRTVGQPVRLDLSVRAQIQ